MDIISSFCAFLIIGLLLAIPIMSIILLIRRLSKKSCKKLGKVVLCCLVSIIPLTIIGVLTDPATWCEHEYAIIEEVDPTCTEKGKVVQKCSLCERESVEYIDMIAHSWGENVTVVATCTQPGYTKKMCSVCSTDDIEYTETIAHSWDVESVVNATCTSEGYTFRKCSSCSAKQKTNVTNALGHSMIEISRVEPTTTSKGKVVYRCERCEREEKETLKKLDESLDSSNNNTNNYVTGEVVEGTIEDIKSDNIAEKLCTFGFTETEAREIREIFLKCGLTNIDNAEPTDPKATIDGLIAYRVVMDEDRTAWFTIENREVFYIGLNGTDVYDTSQGGFLINIDDVYIPENDISFTTADKLKDLTINSIEPYFVNALWYDGFRYGRSDDNYMVQCEVYAQNRLGVKDWIFAKVWYEYDGTDFVVTGIVIDGVRYK